MRVLSLLLFLLLGASLSMAQEKHQKAAEKKPVKKEIKVETLSLDKDGTLVINTTEIGKDIYGYADIVPLEVRVKDGKVKAIKLLENYEDAEFVDEAVSIISDWIGLDIKEAKVLEVDVVTGATFTSSAIIDNLRVALDYVEKHPKEIAKLKKAKK